MEAREALIQATAALHGDTIGGRRPGVAAGSELARRLDAATLSLTYGRDLLHTHLTRGPRGGLRFRSEWGSVLTTPTARWALLAEMGSLARRLAPVGEQLGLFGPGPRQPPGPPGHQRRVPLAPDHEHLDPPGPPRRALCRSRPGTAAGRPSRRVPAPTATGYQRAGPQPAAGGDRHRGTRAPRRLAVGLPAALAARHVGELAAADRRRQHAHQPPLRDPAPLPGPRAAPGGGASDRLACGRGRHRPDPHQVAGHRPRPRPGHHQQPAAAIPGRG